MCCWLSHYFRLTLRALIFTLSILPLVTSTSQALPQRAVPGQFIVKHKKGATVAAQRLMRTQLGVARVKALPLIGAEVVQTSGKQFDHATAKKLLATGLVEYIEPNYIYSISTTPNDPRWSELWGMNNTAQSGGIADIDLDAPESWDLSTSTEVVVGVVDTGVNSSHPDLAENMWVNPGEIPGNNIDDDLNGVVDDVHGFNAITGSGDAMDDNSHGSHCAGTIGARGNNGIGVVGVAWNVKIMALKFLDATGSGSSDEAVKAIEYAVQMKRRGVNIRVLSNSWGGGGASIALSDAITKANENGIVFVAAAGNSSSDNDALQSFPANYPQENVISVAAVDPSGNLASFSNYGQRSVHIAAPGVEILSTVLGSEYESYNGTSMATPHVSGVAALLLGSLPNLTPAQVRERLMSTVHPLSSLQGIVASAGIVNSNNALRNLLAPAPDPATFPRYVKTQIPLRYNASLGRKVLEKDDGYIEATLPFSFSFYNTSFRRIAISSNGRVIPLREGEDMPDDPDYSNWLAPGISIFNDDLYPAKNAQSGVWLSGNDSNATITWVVKPYGLRENSSEEAVLRFQLYLSRTGEIEFHYLKTDTGEAGFRFGGDATVGLAPPSGVVGEKLLILHNEAKPEEVGDGKAIRFTSPSRAVRNDFDGDALSDLVVWRPSSATFFILQSSTEFSPSQLRSYQLGTPNSGERPFVGHFDGDGIPDLGVWNPKNGRWSLKRSVDGWSSTLRVQWGARGEIPVIGDWNGDKRSDLAVFNARASEFKILYSSVRGYRPASSKRKINAGVVVKMRVRGALPVLGNFSGGSADSFAVVRSTPRVWTAKNLAGQVLFSSPWGEVGDRALACDLDANGIDERIAVRDGLGGLMQWYVLSEGGTAQSYEFAPSGGVPLCHNDYNGDGFLDLATFTGETGQWQFRDSGTGDTRTIAFGLNGDIPL